MPEITVIVPVYNTEKYLSLCIDSILEQTFTDFEIIIVNDGSTDQSGSIIQSYLQKDPRVFAIEQENKGLSEARNTGLKIAKGNWITFVDSDDVLSPPFLGDLLKLAQRFHAEIACCASRTFDDTANPTFAHIAAQSKSPGNKEYLLTPTEALINALYQKGTPDYSAWNKLYASNLWKKRRFVPGQYFEDMGSLPQVFLESNSVCFTTKPLYFYRKRPTSILSTAYNRKKAELLDIAENICALVQDQDKDVKQAAACNLFSASCSILMRTPNTKEFEDYRDRAWENILRTRKAAWSMQSRFRNKIAATCSFGGRRILELVLRRFG